jgi:amino acid permease
MLIVVVEFVLGIIKIIAVLGFILFGIIVDCGGVPGDDRGYIGFRYWNDEAHGNKAFRHGKFFTLSAPNATCTDFTKQDSKASARSSSMLRSPSVWPPFAGISFKG